MGHMKLADNNYTGITYYLPLHPVFKTDSATTKLRVVFDDSVATTSGISLNDIFLFKGPKIQPDIIQILWRFRLHKIAITADVVKMYRQMLVAPKDRELQSICYHAKSDEPLKDYKLTTVT